MIDIAHAAIDAGADLVIGHGPHYCLPIEVYKRQADLLRARQLLLPHRPWRAAACRLGRHDGAGGGRSQRRSGRAFRQFVRHNDGNETYLCRLADETEELAHLTGYSGQFGTRLTSEGDQVRIALKG